MSFQSRLFFRSQLYPTAASKFMSVASGTGGVFTVAQRRALGYLVNGLTDLGIGVASQQFLIYPFIGTTAGNNALNLFSAGTSAYNLTFVGSPTQSISGTSFNGTSQYATSISLAVNTLGLSMANLTMAFCTAGMGGGTYIPMGFAMNNNQQNLSYTTAGSYTFNPNVEAPGITAFTITAFGGGGAGGGANGGTSNRPGGGGAGGGYATRSVTLTGTQLNTSISIVVGSGGTAVSAAAGNTGGDSIVTHPNFTGIQAKGGFGGNVNTAGAAGGVSNAPTSNSGATTFNGGGGAAGGPNLGNGGGGGGSSAGTAANGNNGTTPATTTGGAGGTAPTGGVTGGAGGNGTVGGAGFAGNPGTAGGGAGGGAGATNVGNNRAGGAGGDGKVTITWTPALQKRFSMSIFNAGTTNNQLFNQDVGGDSSNRLSYQTSPLLLNGVRCGTRRSNTGTVADGTFRVENNIGNYINGPTVYSDTSLSPSPIWYIGAINSWRSAGGIGNQPGNFYSGYINFALIGPALSDGQLQSLYTLITTYNTTVGR